MTSHKLRYGSGELSTSISGGTLTALLVPTSDADSRSDAEIISKALEEPIGSERLSVIARGKKSAAILIPGKTRVAGTQVYVPALVQELNRAGILDENIKVFLATGTHEHHLECDFESLLGPEISSRIECIAHDCRNESNLKHLGTTSFGTNVRINKQVLDCDVIIPTGRIVPHYFAGFTGGRKAIIPGVAAFDTIQSNHRLTLDERGGITARVGCCLLDGNPVHLDMLEGASMVKPTFIYNTVMDHANRIVGAVAGDWQAAHEAGCRQSKKLYNLTIDRPVDAVITSAGGAPYDCNFMQSLKALFNVKDTVRAGGYILWIAECTHGIQPEFVSWCSIPSLSDLDAAVRNNYDLKGHNSLMLRTLLEKVNVALLSNLPSDVVTKLGLRHVSTLGEGIQWIEQGLGNSFNYAVAPVANVINAAARTPVSQGVC